MNTKNRKNIEWDFISLGMRSVADTCIIPVQDYLGLGDEARINTPSTVGSNWTWRMKANSFSNELTEKIYKLTKLYGRIRK
jgi:4-alpha-glucanotransferase